MEGGRPLPEAPSGKLLSAIQAQHDHTPGVEDVVADEWAGRVLARAIGMRHVTDAVPVLVDEWLGGVW